MRALITGITGFTGPYVAKELFDAGYEVFGLSRRSSVTIPGVAGVFAADAADINSLHTAIESARPDVVVHLAAISFPAHGNANEIYHVNLLCTRNLLEALVKADLPIKAMLLASSGNVYGNATEGVLTEETPPVPANDYAVSKLAMEYLARLYMPRLPIILVRPFNYTGVGQAGHFLIPKIVSHALRKEPVIELGNLDVARDFSDVRDIATIYRRLLETPSAIGNLFNVCSGKAVSLRELLALVWQLSGHTAEVVVNPSFVRSNEVRCLVGSPFKLESVVGAIKRIPIEQTLKWMLTSEVCKTK